MANENNENNNINMVQFFQHLIKNQTFNETRELEWRSENKYFKIFMYWFSTHLNLDREFDSLDFNE